MVVSAGVVAAQAHSSVEQAETVMAAKENVYLSSTDYPLLNKTF